MKYLYISLIITISLNAEMSLREKAFSKGLRATPQNLQELIKEVDDKNNPLTVQKIKLGKKLFFDKNLSFDRTIACASCHDIKKGGEDGKPTAIGYKNQENPSHLTNLPTPNPQLSPKKGSLKHIEELFVPRIYSLVLSIFCYNINS